ncbi:YqzE family protein [Cohnella mopanensis]|uniref:YqzE family protein n=1 Tax=Cohnella mopanensis TaxID=2911966 RepID=UPI001EF8201C|nr:YqzE family protein [Cohnella mopanensis]
MDSSEYLKYMTEKVVKYIDSPTEADAEETKPNRKISREPWLTRWFGMAPMGIMMWWGSRTNRNQETHPEVRSVNDSLSIK